MSMHMDHFFGRNARMVALLFLDGTMRVFNRPCVLTLL